ncbi:zinc ABC transporter substrate-binding protein [Nisaea sp.]|uniref:zinc ABC transporter substrate-binding protein n=1 Tax=Nisaea sp. TaxID=2024842 RepID=UPI003B517707
MIRFIRCVAGLFSVLLIDIGSARAELSVVASIPPIHSLVAKVMAGTGEPRLILRNGQSPHDYALRPSDARALEKADLVFLVSHRIETFLDASLESAEGDGRYVELGDAHGVLHLPVREGVLWEHHDHGHHDDHGEAEEGHDGHEDHAGHGEEEHESEEHVHDAHEDPHDHHGYDPHVWLSTRNAQAFVDAIAQALAKTDPAHAALYADNAKAVHLEMQALSDGIAAKLAPVRDRPFLVFHDAFQYFEAEFDLAAAGAISVSDAAAPGAKRLLELRHRVSEGDIRCIFREVQFSPRLAEVVAEGTGTKLGMLDPVGSALDFGPDNYNGLMQGLADSFVSCLK